MAGIRRADSAPSTTRAVVLALAFAAALLGGRLWAELSGSGIDDAALESGEGSQLVIELTRRVRHLEQALESQAAAQQTLERSLTELQAQLHARLAAAGAGSKPGSTGGDAPLAPASVEPVGDGTAADSLGDREQALVRRGISPDRALAITRDLDQVAMQRLELKYRAAREGWLDTPEYAEALAALPDERRTIQDAYGDDVYDRFLYANLEPNRVVVRSTMADSAAARIGLRRGDMVLSLNGNRLYSVSDLMAAAAAAGDAPTVPITVLRGQRQFVAYVEPGPLGIHAGPGYADPDQSRSP